MDKERWLIDLPDAGAVDAMFAGDLLVLWHGAGGDIGEASLVELAREFAARGGIAARARFPYRRAGKKLPDRMPALVKDARETIALVRAAAPSATRRVFLGGRSMGGRTASMLAAEGDAIDALVFLAYPLHPAGQPQKLRDAHLPDISCPMLFVQGDRDDLCDLELLRPVLDRLGKKAELALFPGGDHSLKKPGPKVITTTVLDWLAKLA